MKGLDDGPDGLNDDAFDRALRRLPGVKRTARRGHAKVIKLGTSPDRVATEPLPVYDPDAAATAWIAELRDRGGIP
jgi:hypothetical protein